MRPVGYLLNTREGLAGEPGIYYDYIIAGNGVFVRSRNRCLEATVNVTWADVRGLLPLYESLSLPGGRVPRQLYNLALSLFSADPWNEHYVAVTWNGCYHLKMPIQEKSPGKVRYERLPDTMMDIHSHGLGSAWFSGTDNRDEQEMKVYMVVGEVDKLFLEVDFRVGVYGYFAPVELSEVFNVQS